MEVKWNLNGNWLLTASRDHLCKLFDIRNLKEELQVFRGHKKEATGECEEQQSRSPTIMEKAWIRSLKISRKYKAQIDLTKTVHISYSVGCVEKLNDKK